MIDKINTLWDQLRVCGKQTWNEYGIKKCSIELDPSEYRLDDFGAIIKKSDRESGGKFGWTLDHIFPVSLGGGDDLLNLRLLHWRNNQLKKNDFPTHSWDTSIKFESKIPENYSEPRIRLTVHRAIVDSLAKIYPRIMDYYFHGTKNSGGIYNL